jgi:Hemerythrin HHE cation binding domain
VAQVSEQLIDDHAALDKVLKQFQTALRGGELKTAHAKLDLFWARLAVHIRAEHLHLFPTALRSLKIAGVNLPSVASLDEAETVIAELRQDHDFFMHGLARAVEITRKLSTVVEHPLLKEGLNTLTNIVFEIEQRLLKHNETEENQVYRWATALLNSEEQAKLANQITTELRTHPSRFTLSTWLNE